MNKTLSKTGNWLLKHTLTVASSVLIIVLGIVLLARSSPGTTRIGESIITGDFTATGTISGATISEGGTGLSEKYALADTTPPAAVNDLVASDPTHNSIKLTWTAPGDDGMEGTATTYYDIRYATSIIDTEAKWDAATSCTGEPTPSLVGSTETFTVTGLSHKTKYYFALRTADDVPNWSALSNIESKETKDMKRVFVTSTTYNGDLVTAGEGGGAHPGLDGADNLCQARANAGGLGGDWTAWLSDSTMSASDRVTHTEGAYVLIDGSTIIASGWSDLTDSELDHAIDITENGDKYSGQNSVWTGTMYRGDSSRENCVDWGNGTQAEEGTIGAVNYTDDRWTEVNESECHYNLRLYCFEN